MNGYKGAILRIDLSSGGWEKAPLDTQWVEHLLGGKGLAYAQILKDLPAGTDPLSPSNELIFATGPLSGTLVPTSSRMTVVTKSPATGTILGTHVGGSIAGEIKYAGYDAIVIEGASEKPVYLLVSEDGVQLRDASELWGKGIYESSQSIRRGLEDDRIRMIGIGPAGENLVKFACLVTDHYHAAGRGGAGAVMGSKNLKALVVRGKGGVAVRDVDGLLEYLRKIKEESWLNEDHEWTYDEGTPGTVAGSNEIGVLPTRNFQAGRFDGASAIGAEAALALATTENRLACLSCPLACGRYVETSTGQLERAQYETLALAGSNCGIDDLAAVTEFSNLCNDLGMDTISAGNTIGFAMELTERGVHDFGARFGDAQGLLRLAGDIAHRRGDGEALAEGVRSAADLYHRRGAAMEIKGLEFPGYDPRGAFSMALAYASAHRGACHCRAFPIEEDGFGELDPFTFEGKAELVVEGHHYSSVKECLALCDFWGVSLETASDLIGLTTDYQFSPQDLERVGERVWNLGRLFNVREGFKRQDDSLPQRLLTDLLDPGPPTQTTIDGADFQECLSEYYQLRGWDDQGTPTRGTLDRLGLLGFAEAMEQGGAS
jgi:aldehyde:ferredoxin oxidoreductase